MPISLPGTDLRQALRAILLLVALAFPVELLWEFAQFPLYAQWYEEPLPRIIAFGIHCTIGDLLILAGTYALTAFFMAQPRLHSAPGRGWVLFTLLGAGYTVYSELANVYPRGSWSYAESMPMVPLLHVGLTPLLQWVVLPPLLLFAMKRLEASGRARRVGTSVPDSRQGR